MVELDGLLQWLAVGQRSEYFRTQLRMSLDYEILAFAELAGLVKDALGDKELAHIVHAPREDDVFHFLLRELQSARDDSGIVRAAFSVSIRVRLPHLGGAGHRFDSFFQGQPVDFFSPPAQLA